MIVFEIIARTLLILLSLFETALVVRAILSWIPSARTSRVAQVLNMITEPIVHPVRKLLFKMEWVRRCPIDLSVLAVFILISFLERFLYYFI
jgi:YggT family protein